MAMHDRMPLLVTLDLDPASFDRLQALRTRYFPPERNVVPAHVSLFHALPGSELRSIRETLNATTRPPITIRFGTLKRLGGGMAISMESSELAAVHGHLSREFFSWLTPQDRQPYRPHVTIMNKAEPYQAALAFAELSASWTPLEGTGQGLLLWEYLGGPWRPVDRFPFSGGSGTIGA